MKLFDPNHPTVKLITYNILLPLAIIFAACMPLYQSQVQHQNRLVELEREALLATQRAGEVEEIPPAEIQEAIDALGYNRFSIAESDTAKRAITDRNFELQSGYCSRFVRQVVEATHGKKYSHLFGATAKISANLFLDSAYGYYWPAEKSALGGVIQVGDILFKRNAAGGFGHVGIYVGNDRVAENSSTSIGRVQGAKGYRTLAEYGAFDVLGRLPLPAGYLKPAKKPRLILAVNVKGALKYVEVTATLRDGRWRANAKELSREARSTVLAATGEVKVVEYLALINRTPFAYGDHLADKNDPRTYLFIKS